MRSSAHTACIIRVLKVKTSSVVLLPGLYAACVTLISFLIVSKVLLTIIIANTFLSTESSIIGLKFSLALLVYLVLEAVLNDLDLFQ